MKNYLLIAVLATGFIFTGCSKDKTKPNIEVIQEMMDHPSIKAQEYDESLPHNRGMLLPPEGTVPVGYSHYKYVNNPNGAASELSNPYKGNVTDEILLQGQMLYETYCSVCHGQKGSGKGTVAPDFALKPPSLLTNKIMNWEDGRLYHTIHQGQGLMGGYAGQIQDRDGIWALVSYIKYLQTN